MPSLSLIKRRVQGQTFEGQTYENMDLSSMLAFGSKWFNCTFNNCDMSLADLRSSQVEGCLFMDCQMAVVNFAGGAAIRHCVFDGCKMKQAIFAGVSPLDDVRFTRCAMHYSTFYDATVREITFDGSNLHGADLRFIESHGVSFRDSVLWNAAITLGCQSLGTQNTFDQRSADLFIAIVARLHPDQEKSRILRELAGEQLATVERLMGAEANVL